VTPAAGVVALLTIAALGPYTQIAGVRTEQIAVYAAFTLGLLRLHWLRTRAPARLTVIVTLLATIASVAIINSVDHVVNLTGYAAGGLVAGLDNLLLPLATIGAVWTAVSGISDLDRPLRVVCRIVVFAAVANAAMAGLSISTDLTPVLARFWENGSGQAVAERAAQLGRFTGIFNQPAEAGMFYSMALLAALYLYRQRTARLALTAPVIVAGGVLTVSKVFLLVGLPVGLFLLLRDRERRARRLIGLGAFSAVGSAAVAAWSGPQWIGGTYLTRLFVPDASGSGLVDLYTAGRLGGESTLRVLVESVLESAPWFGVGAQGLSVAYDNGWVEAMVVAGLTGAVAYTLILGCLLSAWWRVRRQGGPAADLLCGLVVLLSGASVGLPALTANRVATIAWIIVVLLLARPQFDTGTRAPLTTERKMAEEVV
jgi:hypothetical protein